MVTIAADIRKIESVQQVNKYCFPWVRPPHSMSLNRREFIKWKLYFAVKVEKNTQLNKVVQVFFLSLIVLSLIFLLSQYIYKHAANCIMFNPCTNLLNRKV